MFPYLFFSINLFSPHNQSGSIRGCEKVAHIKLRNKRGLPLEARQGKNRMIMMKENHFLLVCKSNKQKTRLCSHIHWCESELIFACVNVDTCRQAALWGCTTGYSSADFAPDKRGREDKFWEGSQWGSSIPRLRNLIQHNSVNARPKWGRAQGQRARRRLPAAFRTERINIYGTFAHSSLWHLSVGHLAPISIK